MTNVQRNRLRQFLFILLLVIVLVLLALNYFFRPFEKRFSVSKPVINNYQDSLVKESQHELTANTVLAKLSTQQKIAQMIAQPVVVASDSTKLVKPAVPYGFITIFGKDIDVNSAVSTIKFLRTEYSLNQELAPFTKPLFIVDHEGGSVQRLSGEGYTPLPSWYELCSLEASDLDSNKFEAKLDQSAQELKKTGIDIVLAPVLDVGKNSFLKDRVCSSSYIKVAEKSTIFIDVFNQRGIMPVVKHFPGIGKVKKDLHQQFATVTVTSEDVSLYKHVVSSAKEVGVMISHAGVSNQDSQLSCSLSASCVGEFSKVFPKVLIFSDALEMKSARFKMDDENNLKDLVTVTREAILAGDEVLLYGPSVETSKLDGIILQLVNEYHTNFEFKEKVDRAVLKIMEYKYEKK